MLVVNHLQMGGSSYCFMFASSCCFLLVFWLFCFYIDNVVAQQRLSEIHGGIQVVFVKSVNLLEVLDLGNRSGELEKLLQNLETSPSKSSKSSTFQQF